jgi:hypothetical protein
MGIKIAMFAKLTIARDVAQKIPALSVNQGFICWEPD